MWRSLANESDNLDPLSRFCRAWHRRMTDRLTYHATESSVMYSIRPNDSRLSTVIVVALALAVCSDLLTDAVSLQRSKSHAASE